MEFFSTRVKSCGRVYCWYKVFKHFVNMCKLAFFDILLWIPRRGFGVR